MIVSRSGKQGGGHHQLIAFICAIVFAVTVYAGGHRSARKMKGAINDAATESSKAMTVIEYELIETQGEDITKPKILRYAAREVLPDGASRPISVHRWATLIRGEEAETLVSTFNSVLKESPMNAFFFETKGVTLENSHQKSFEFVLVDTENLYSFADTHVDRNTFAEHLKCLPISQLACEFPSLSTGTILIAPKKLDGANSSAYGHLAAFSRRGLQLQIAELWRTVANAYLKRLEREESNSIWLSSDGTGVAWLHIRLDDRPKYYKYKAFAGET